MTIGQSMLAELDHEMSGLRKTLERLPADKADWTPHPKSMPLGKLAVHVVEMMGWVTPTLTIDALEIGGYTEPAFAGVAPLLAQFDERLAGAKAALAAVPDEKMMAPWSLTVDGRAVMSMPRIVAVRSMILNHLIHHRAQLGLYLRMLDVPVPALYGPSADER